MAEASSSGNVAELEKELQRTQELVSFESANGILHLIEMHCKSNSDVVVCCTAQSREEEEWRICRGTEIGQGAGDSCGKLITVFYLAWI